MEILQSLPPLVTLVLSLLLVVWLVLFLLVPFMLESIRSWTRRNHAELAEMNKKLDRLTALLGDRMDEAIRRDARAPRTAPGDARSARGERARKEPTISG
jgi:predicted PurR-regulated permease PerM